MNVVTLRDYAKQNNISYEAVRKQVVRYKKDLEGHLIKDGRQQFLDEEAVAFLDAKRQKNPVAIIQMDKDETIEGLESENKMLLQKLAWVQDELLKAKDENNNLKLENAKIALLEAENGKKDDLLAEVKKEAQNVSDELSEVRTQMEHLQKENEQMKSAGFWQRLRGWKKGIDQ